jgi:hypothetical protein
MCDTTPTEQGRQALKTTAKLQHGNDAVKLAAMVKPKLRMQQVIANLATQAGQAT